MAKRRGRRGEGEAVAFVSFDAKKKRRDACAIVRDR